MSDQNLIIVHFGHGTDIERKAIGIGLPITEEPSHTTWHTDRYLGGSADQAD